MKQAQAAKADCGWASAAAASAAGEHKQATKDAKAETEVHHAIAANTAAKTAATLAQIAHLKAGGAPVAAEPAAEAGFTRTFSNARQDVDEIKLLVAPAVNEPALHPEWSATTVPVTVKIVTPEGDGTRCAFARCLPRLVLL